MVMGAALLCLDLEIVPKAVLQAASVLLFLLGLSSMGTSAVPDIPEAKPFKQEGRDFLLRSQFAIPATPDEVLKAI